MKGYGPGVWVLFYVLAALFVVFILAVGLALIFAL